MPTGCETATHCITLQDTARHCNTLQHIQIPALMPTGCATVRPITSALPREGGTNPVSILTARYFSKVSSIIFSYSQFSHSQTVWEFPQQCGPSRAHCHAKEEHSPWVRWLVDILKKKLNGLLCMVNWVANRLLENSLRISVVRPRGTKPNTSKSLAKRKFATGIRNGNSRVPSRSHGAMYIHYRSLLQKSPTKEPIFCKRDL